MAKINMKPTNQPKQNLQKLTDEQLTSLQDELLKTNDMLVEKSSKQQFIVRVKLEALKDLCKRIKEHVLPQIEYDIRLVTDVVDFNAWLDSVIDKGRVTITSMEFRRIIRALSVSKFKGVAVAIVLDELSAAFNSVSQDINKADQALQANSVKLTEIDNEMQRRATQKASNVATGQAD